MCSSDLLLADLSARGIARLMVEGGTTVFTGLLGLGAVDELQLVIAPFFVGDASAPRFVHPWGFPASPDHPLQLIDNRRIGDLVLLRYRPA